MRYRRRMTMAIMATRMPTTTIAAAAMRTATIITTITSYGLLR